MKVSVLTLGCKTNLSESDLFKSAVIEAGHKLASLEEQPDICIINTCTVTAKADYQCRQLIRKALRKGAKRVIVTGCYAQHTPETIRKISPQIEVVPGDKKDNIINMLSDNTSSSLINIPRARPFVKIQEGCDFRCSYCIVWKVRGRSRSVPQEEIIERVKALEERGYLEVVLTGTHIGLYGKDISPEVSLYTLMVNLLKNTKKIRFRLSSLEVQELTEGIMELLEEERVCKHLHIPLQSGDEGILAKMKRPYTVSSFIETVKKIAERYPDAAIGTDVIVGFPGEGEKEFASTVKVVKELPFSYLHVFPFSARPGTPASKMKGQVTKKDKQARALVLREIDQAKREHFRRRFIGKTLACVYEEDSSDGLSINRSDNYIRVYTNRIIESKRRVPIKIKISDLFRDGLFGEPVDV